MGENHNPQEKSNSDKPGVQKPGREQGLQLPPAAQPPLSTHPTLLTEGVKKEVTRESCGDPPAREQGARPQRVGRAWEAEAQQVQRAMLRLPSLLLAGRTPHPARRSTSESLASAGGPLHSLHQGVQRHTRRRGPAAHGAHSRTASPRRSFFGAAGRSGR